MLPPYSEDYLLDKKVKIYQPLDGYRASSDAVLLSATVNFQSDKIKILDVGSGTGAISLCLAKRLGSQVEIYGVDIQPELVQLANYSAEQNNFSNVKFVNRDIREKINDEQIQPCSFDVVISNPPYSEHDMPSPNKSKAAAHNHSNFSLNEWLKLCLKMAKPFGYIYLINRAEALPQICTSLQGKAGGITILPVYSKQEQNAKRVIIKAQKDSKAPGVILPSFYVHETDGKYSIQAQKILRKGKSFAELNFNI